MPFRSSPLMILFHSEHTLNIRSLNDLISLEYNKYVLATYHRCIVSCGIRPRKAKVYWKRLWTFRLYPIKNQYVKTHVSIWGRKVPARQESLNVTTRFESGAHWQGAKQNRVSGQHIAKYRYCLVLCRTSKDGKRSEQFLLQGPDV